MSQSTWSQWLHRRNRVSLTCLRHDIDCTQALQTTRKCNTACHREQKCFADKTQCAGSLASAWLTGRPGTAELTAAAFCISARLRLGEDVFVGQDRGDACVCGRSMTAGDTHSLICGALWHTVVARHNALTEAWLRIAARTGIAAACEPHVKQLPQRDHATGPPALPNRNPSAPSAAGRMPARANSAAPGIPSQPLPRLCLLPSMAPRLPAHLPLPPQQRLPPPRTWPLLDTLQMPLPAQPQQQPLPPTTMPPLPAVASPPAPYPPHAPGCCCRRPFRRRHGTTRLSAALPA